MAKQKSGLHKEVGEIFDGLQIEENHSQVSIGLESSKEDQPKSSFPGNIAITPATTQHVQSNPASKPAFDINKPAEDSNKDFKNSSNDIAKSSDSKKSVMLPASLSQKPQMKFIDELKIKIDEYVEQNGKKQLVLTCSIPFLAIAMVTMLWINLAPKGSSQIAEQADNNVQLHSQVDKNVVWETPSVYPKKLRDPMKQASVSVYSTEFQIKGIVYMEGNPAESVALIGNMNVHIGEEFNGIKVVDIQRDYVELDINGKSVKQGVGR